VLASIAMKKQFHAIKARLSGLTLIEILVSLAVLGVLVAVAVPSMADLLEKRRVTAAAEEVAGILTYAKAETNATNSLLFVRFDPDPNEAMSCAVVVTTAGINACRCHRAVNDICPGTASRPLRLFQLPKSHVKFKAFADTWITTPSLSNYIRFTRDQNTLATEGFQVDVTGLKRGYTLRVEVNAIGRVKVCAPDAPRVANALFSKMSGYGACG